MKPRSERATLKDVARFAGMSSATVSRVLRSSGPTSAETRSQVMAAIEAVGYQKGTGEKPAGGKPYPLVALMISDIMNPFFPEIVRGVEDEAIQSGYGLLLYNTAEDSGLELKLIQQMMAWKVTGIIFCSARVASQNLVSLYENTGLPLVLINRRVDHPKIPAIVIDFKAATTQATQHLLNLGHTRIAYLGGLPGSETSMKRCEGIQTALARAGLALRPEWCIHNFPNVEGGFQGMSALLAQSGALLPTAVIAYNDMIAIGAMNAIRAYPLRVPEDISVVGFDGISLAAYTNPPLTTINQPKFQMGSLAMRMLHAMIQGQAMPGGGYMLMESPLIIRASTAPPRIENR